MGGYLPRVWWKSDDALAEGVIAYGGTVYEMNANGLSNCLSGTGHDYGWVPNIDMQNAQDAANEGWLVVIVAENPHGPGHISVVLPEKDNLKERIVDEKFIPLQSQAGGENFTTGYNTANPDWFDDDTHINGSTYIYKGGRFSDIGMMPNELEGDVLNTP